MQNNDKMLITKEDILKHLKTVNLSDLHGALHIGLTNAKK
jgi:hypothetical protein